MRWTQIFLLVFTYNTLISQNLIDNFSDSNFENPEWFGDTTLFKVNDELQMQLNDQEVLNTQSFVSTPIVLQDSAHWEFYLKTNFSASPSNFTTVVLGSINANLLEDDNGYYLKIGGISGNDDNVELFKKINGIKTTIIKSEVGSANGELTFQINLDRTPSGNWTLKIDSDLDGNPNFEYDGFENNIFKTNYFGFICEYTATRKDKFFFDDILVGPEYQDLLGPKIVEVNAITADSIQVFFDENILFNQATFSIVELPSCDLSITSSTSYSLTFSLSQSLIDGNSYTLSALNVKDELGNVTDKTGFNFSFEDIRVAKPNDIIINEIFADPTPSVGLPEEEFIEIYNAANYKVNLRDWAVNINNHQVLIETDYILNANQYLVFCEAGNEDLFAISNIMGISGFPTLKNTDGYIELENQYSEIIDHTIYTDKLYQNSNKKNGGWSLELINYKAKCENAWTASTNISGGTPGYENAVFDPTYQTKPFELDYVSVIDSSTIELIFNQYIQNIDQFTNNGSFLFNPPLLIENISKPDNSLNSIQIQFDKNLDDISYDFSFEGELSNCLGEKNKKIILGDFIIPKAVETGDIIINEILFNPISNGYDFIELYNNSNKVFDISHISISNPIISSSNKIIQSKLFLPHTYFVITENKNYILNNFKVLTPENIIENNIPTMPDDQGQITIFYNHFATKIIDDFIYNKDFHNKLLFDTEGISLERISNTLNTNDENNWHSASSLVRATPTYTNSQSSEITMNASFSITNETFSPNGDGTEDYLLISFSQTEPQNINAKVLDIQGRHIRTLYNNELLGSHGTLKLDGLNDNNQLVNAGIYILEISTFSIDSGLNTQHLTCVLAY